MQDDEAWYAETGLCDSPSTIQTVSAGSGELMANLAMVIYSLHRRCCGLL